MLFNFFPELCVCLLCDYLLRMDALEESSYFISNCCGVAIILHMTHIKNSYPAFRRWYYRLPWPEKPVFKQDVRVLGNCCICLDEIVIIDGRASPTFGGVIRLICGHYFHHRCLWDWIFRTYGADRDPNCPMCRQRMKFYWTDYGFSATMEPYDFNERTSIDVQLCMYRLWQYLELILLLCLSANPIYQGLEKLIGDSLHIVHLLLLEHIYIWHSVIQLFSFLLGTYVRCILIVFNFLLGACLRCIIAAFSFLTGLELPATYVALVT
jgi:hypothetical protein